MKTPKEIIDLAIQKWAPKEQHILASCAVTRLCLHLIPEGENRPRVAIETAEAWARGEATAEQVKKACKDIDSLAGISTSILKTQPLASTAAKAAFYAAYAACSDYTHTSADSTVAAAIQAGIPTDVVSAALLKNFPNLGVTDITLTVIKATVISRSGYTDKLSLTLDSPSTLRHVLPWMYPQDMG